MHLHETTLDTDDTVAVSSDLQAPVPNNRALVPIPAPKTPFQLIEQVQKAFAEWLPAHQRANSHLHLLLGRIYAACPLFTAASSELYALVKQVRQHPDVGQSNRWDPFKKAPEDLFLTMLLGLKNLRSTKSQWRRALTAAKEANVERTEAAFVAWIKEQNGIGGVSTTKNTDRAEQFASLVEEVSGYQDSDVTVSIPQGSIASLFPGKVGLVLIGAADDGKNIKALGTLDDEGLVASAIKAFLANVERSKKEQVRDFERELLEQHEHRRKDHKRYVKAGDFVGSFKDFVRAGAPEI